MKASVKYKVIHRFKDKYSVKDMCYFFGVSRSGYYAWTKKINKEDPDKAVGELIQQCQRKTRQTYGYRRVQIWLLREFGLIMNHKTVLRVMNKYNLLSKSRRRRKWMQNCESVHKHTSYVGLYIGLGMFTAQVVVGAMVAVVSIVQSYWNDSARAMRRCS